MGLMPSVTPMPEANERRRTPFRSNRNNLPSLARFIAIDSHLTRQATVRRLPTLAHHHLERGALEALGIEGLVAGQQ